METIYEELSRFAKVYRKGNQDPMEMANICYVEFVENNYLDVYNNLEPQVKEPFLRSFVKKRCYRELTRSSKIYPVEDLSYLPDDRTPFVNMEEARSALAETSIVSALKEQERVVLDLLMDGATRREIASQISRSLGTVQNIIERIKKNPEVLKLREAVYGEMN